MLLGNCTAIIQALLIIVKEEFNQLPQSRPFCRAHATRCKEKNPVREDRVLVKTKGSLALAATAANQMGPESRSTEREEGVGRRFRNYTDVVKTDRRGVATSGPKRDKN